MGYGTLCFFVFLISNVSRVFFAQLNETTEGKRDYVVTLMEKVSSLYNGRIHILTKLLHCAKSPLMIQNDVIKWLTFDSIAMIFGGNYNILIYNYVFLKNKIWIEKLTEQNQTKYIIFMQTIRQDVNPTLEKKQHL